MSGCVRLPRPARVCCKGVWLEIALGLGGFLAYAGNWRCLRLWGVGAFELGITISLMSYVVFRISLWCCGPIYYDVKIFYAL